MTGKLDAQYFAASAARLLHGDFANAGMLARSGVDLLPVR